MALLACFSLLCGTKSNSWPAETSIGTNRNEWCIEVQLLTNFFLYNTGILERETLVMTILYSSFCLDIKSCMREYSSLECRQESWLHLQEALNNLYSQGILSVCLWKKPASELGVTSEAAFLGLMHPGHGKPQSSPSPALWGALSASHPPPPVMRGSSRTLHRLLLSATQTLCLVTPFASRNPAPFLCWCFPLPNPHQENI